MSEPIPPAAPATPPAAPVVEPPKSETVSREAHDRLLAETKAEREAKRAAEAELAKYRDADRKKAEAEALARGEHEKVIGERDAEIARIKKERDELIETQTNGRKLAALNRGVGSQIDSRFYSLLDLDQIKVNQDGSLNADSLNKYVEEFKKTYPELLGKAPGAAPASPAPGSNNGGIITDEQFAAMTPKERKENVVRYAEQLRAAK